MDSKPLEGCSSGIQSSKSTGALLLTLNTRKERFQKEAVRVAKSRSKLHKMKTELQKAIAEYKKLEREVRQKKTHYERTLQQFEAAIQESHNPCYDKSDNDEIILWNCSTFVKCHTKKQIEDIDKELSEPKLIDPSAENPKNASLKSVIPVPCSVLISNIDSSGSIQRNGVAKIVSSKKCCICMEKEINSIFYECKHECCCINCATNLIKHEGKCPICQHSTKKVIKTYAI